MAAGGQVGYETQYDISALWRTNMADEVGKHPLLLSSYSC